MDKDDQHEEHKGKHQDDFAEGQENPDHEEDETRGTFAEGQTDSKDPAIDAPKGFFAEGEAENEEEDLKPRGTFAEGQSKEDEP